MGDSGTTRQIPARWLAAGPTSIALGVLLAVVVAELVAGAVYCWGENIFRQLGQASGDSYATPTEIAGLTDAVSISTGGLHTCARRAGGSVVCWGNNDSGERGDATPATPSATRVTVSSLSASLLASGGIHNCALQDNGSAVCWGNNLYGQLGNGETSSTHLIQSISPL